MSDDITSPASSDISDQVSDCSVEIPEEIPDHTDSDDRLPAETKDISCPSQKIIPKCRDQAVRPKKRESTPKPTKNVSSKTENLPELDDQTPYLDHVNDSGYKSFFDTPSTCRKSESKTDDCG